MSRARRPGRRPAAALELALLAAAPAHVDRIHRADGSWVLAPSSSPR